MSSGARFGAVSVTPDIGGQAFSVRVSGSKRAGLGSITSWSSELAWRWQRLSSSGLRHAPLPVYALPIITYENLGFSAKSKV